MAENKTAAQAAVDVQLDSKTAQAAKAYAVTDDKIQRDYEALVAGLDSEGFAAQTDSLEGLPAGAVADFARDLGATLREEALIARFEGVKENLLREIKGGMCTLDQAYAYLENIEISLLLEQEAIVTAR